MPRLERKQSQVEKGQEPIPGMAPRAATKSSGVCDIKSDTDAPDRIRHDADTSLNTDPEPGRGSLSSVENESASRPHSAIRSAIVGLIALITITVAAAAPKAIWLLSALVSVMGLLGTLSPETPIARRLLSRASDLQIDTVLSYLRSGIRGWVAGLAIFALVGMTLFLDFIGTFITVLAVLFGVAAIAAVGSIMSRGIVSRGMVLRGVVFTVLIPVSTLAIGGVCKYRIEDGALGSLFATVKGSGSLGDPHLVQAESLSEYTVLYYHNYLFSAAANRFLVVLEEFKEPYGRAREATGAGGRGVSVQAGHELSYVVAWEHYRSLLRLPEVVEAVERDMSRRCESATKRKTLTLLPYYLKPTYIASLVVTGGAEHLASLAVTTKLALAWLTFGVVGASSTVWGAIALLAMLAICISVSRLIGRYNAAYGGGSPPKLLILVTWLSALLTVYAF